MFTILWVGVKPEAGDRRPDLNHLFVSSPDDATEVITNYEIDVLICAEDLPDGRGQDLLRHVQKTTPSIARILVTGDEPPATRENRFIAPASTVISRMGLGRALRVIGSLVQESVSPSRCQT